MTPPRLEERRPERNFGTAPPRHEQNAAVGQVETGPTELRIWMLGGLRVAVDGVDVPQNAWRRSKPRSLVKLLALAPAHRLHREQLMEWLWSDLDPTAAGATLRKAIHFSRCAIGAGAVRVNDEIVRLEAGTLWVDVDAFEAAAHAGDAAGALELYAGDLLPEDRYEPWAERPRDQLRTTAVELLLDHSQVLERRGDRRGAAVALERLVTLEPLSEAGHCGLIRLHARSGRRDVALRWYRQLEDRLATELGVTPGDSARRLFDELLADGTAAPDGDGPSGSSALDDRDDVGGLAPRLDEERKLVTIVVVDLRGGESATKGGGMSAARPNPERIRSALDDAATRAAGLLGRWGARAERQIGGTVVGVFGVPSTDERDAEHALRAAIDIVEQAKVSVRIGVDTGLVVAPTAPGGDLRSVAGEALE